LHGALRAARRDGQMLPHRRVAPVFSVVPGGPKMERWIDQATSEVLMGFMGIYRGFIGDL